MEKTIEERAREYAEKSFAQRIKIPEEEITERQKSRIMNGYVAVYTKIATEQKAIDDEQLPLIKETYYNAGYETAKNKMIDKACEWLTERCAFGVHPCSGTALVMEFRKAMEE